MVVSIDIGKDINLSRVSVFSGGQAAGGSTGSKGKSGGGNGGGILEDMGGVFSLSYKQRLWGFAICLAIGAGITGLAYLAITPLANIKLFVVLYSFGNIVAICSTMFLMGPLNQLKRMFDPIRVVATVIFLVSIGLAIYFGLKGNLLLALLFGVIEFLAFFWYSISYIPYARTLVLRCIGLA